MLETDYLIIGAGAVGMNIADVLLAETDADILIVDLHEAPGGHWNDAYSFVRLHQPSVHYGVSSRRLGSDRIDAAGSNKGYYDLPSGAEVIAYFDSVMRERLLPSGRVRYLPLHETSADATSIKTMLSGVVTPVKARVRVVDTTFMNSRVPSTHTASFTVADGVRVVTPNNLPRAAGGADTFTIIGGGKTAMDTCVWLISNGATPDQIRWIRPRESWMINRATTQPGDDFFYAKFGGYADMLEAAAHGETVEDIFVRLEASGFMLRIDTEIWPTSYRNATISKDEVALLRSVTDVIRKGRVRAIGLNAIELDEGTAPAAPDHLYIDCSAKAFDAKDSVPIFSTGRMHPQIVINGGLCLSAGIVAWVEANYEDDAEKNDLLAPIPLMNTDADWLAMIYWHLRNSTRWANEKELGRWIKVNRMSGHGGPKGTRDAPDPAYLNLLARLKTATPLAIANLERLVDTTAHPNG